jgi:hypothetical protein
MLLVKFYVKNRSELKISIKLEIQYFNSRFFSYHSKIAKINISKIVLYIVYLHKKAD